MPWVAVAIELYDASYSDIPVNVSAFGNGIAYNALVNLFERTGKQRAMTANHDIPRLAAGERGTVNIPMVQHPFLGKLEVGFFDPTGARHIAWHTVNCASGRLRTTDPMHWECPGSCKVHPVRPVRS